MDSPTKRRAASPKMPAQLAGTKRPAPTLLPPFEPLLSSSPGLPRPLKRAREDDSHTKYPTPVPTSSTGILSSSPPRVHVNRSGNQHHHHPHGPVPPDVPIVSDKRAPLGSVPSIDLAANGEFVLMGRSSSSSHYQLSANRLISRVHVKARYIAPSTPATENDASATSTLAAGLSVSSATGGKVEVICTGWNGIKLHCQGRTWELGKGDTFTSETEQAEIMIDVQDARVRLHWPSASGDRRVPRSESLANLSDCSWDNSPSRPVGLGLGGGLGGSPLRRRADRIASPDSPTPLNHSSGSLGGGLGGLLGSIDDEVQIYEDTSEPELPSLPRDDGIIDPNTSMCTIPVDSSFSSDLSDPDDYDENDNNPNEENDPIVHSFGPFGANLSGRLAAFSHNSPRLGTSPGGIMRGGSSTASRRAPLGAPIRTGNSSAARALSSLASTSDLHSADRPSKETVTKASVSRANASHDGSSTPTGPMTSAPRSGSPTPTPQSVGDKPAPASAVDTTPKAQQEKEKEEEVAITVPAATAEAIKNHIINQLAFSRLSSSPLTLIFSNLPPAERKALGLKGQDDVDGQSKHYKTVLPRLLGEVDCIGRIDRTGKDAAGKMVENEFYYIPERDGDEQRKGAVVQGRGRPSLRACRKVHKQYYWKKPKTP